MTSIPQQPTSETEHYHDLAKKDEVEREGGLPAELATRIEEVNSLAKIADPAIQTPESAEVPLITAEVVGDCSEGLENPEGLYVVLSKGDLERLGLSFRNASEAPGSVVAVSKDGVYQMPCLTLRPTDSDKDGECRAIHAAIGDTLTISALATGEMPPTTFPVQMISNDGLPKTRRRLGGKNITTWIAIPPVVAHHLNLPPQKGKGGSRVGKVGYLKGQETEVVIDGRAVKVYLDSQGSGVSIPEEIVPALGLTIDQLASGQIHAAIKNGQLHLQTAPFQEEEEKQ